MKTGTEEERLAFFRRVRKPQNLPVLNAISHSVSDVLLSISYGWHGGRQHYAHHDNRSSLEVPLGVRHRAQQNSTKTLNERLITSI